MKIAGAENRMYETIFVATEEKKMYGIRIQTTKANHLVLSIFLLKTNKT